MVSRRKVKCKAAMGGGFNSMNLAVDTGTNNNFVLTEEVPGEADGLATVAVHD